MIETRSWFDMYSCSERHTEALHMLEASIISTYIDLRATQTATPWQIIAALAAFTKRS